MRTGPFSDPIVVNLINRYFVPVHVDNQDWTEPHYGIAPGEENAYIIIRSPLEESESTLRFLKRLSEVLDPIVVRRELLQFLDAHPELDRRGESDSQIGDAWRRAQFLLEEGAAQDALHLLANAGGASSRQALLTARAHRQLGHLTEARTFLERASEGAELEMELIRLAHLENQRVQLAQRLDAFLQAHGDSADAAEAFWLRGWLYHEAGRDDLAVETWQKGINQHPPWRSLFSQKAYYTVIRLNWDLPDNVDQEP